MIRTGYLPSHYGPASVLGLATGLISHVLISKALWPTSLPYFDQHLAGWLALRLHGIDAGFFPETALRYSHYLSTLAPEFSAGALTARFDLATVLSIGVAVGVTLLVGKGKPDTRTIAGRQLYEGRAAHRILSARAKEDIAISGEGLKLHPSFKWHVSRDRESRHWLFLGSIGGGKTQAIKPLLQAAIARGDRVVLYDSKGDFTAEMDAPFVLVTPWDARGMAWDIAADCTTQQDARELAARLIPSGHDPLWHNAARQILTAIIQMLQSESPETWSWDDLYRVIGLPQEALEKIVLTYAPEARRAIESEGKTVEGILINFATYMTIVADLAAAWGEAPAETRFSFSQWLQDPNPEKKVIIFQGSGRFQELTRGYVQSIISLLSGRICSTDVGESKTRRLWLFLDEFPQLGKLDGFASILEVGRSKGVCCVLGAQDLSQIEEIYGQYVAKTWGSLVGTQIVVRLNSGATAQFFAKDVIGYATIEKTVMHEGKPQPAQTQQQLILEPSDISDYLGPTKTGVRAVLLGMGDVFILEWPYTSNQQLREASIEAAWVKHARSNKQLPPPVSTTPDLPPPPKIKLRMPTPAEVREMAESGSDIQQAAEPRADMETGGDATTGGAA